MVSNFLGAPVHPLQLSAQLSTSNPALQALRASRSIHTIWILIFKLLELLNLRGFLLLRLARTKGAK